jgi:chromosomal replication initiator protein
MRDWIDNHYLDRILSILSKEVREVKSVIIDVASIDLNEKKVTPTQQDTKIGVSLKASESLLDHNSVGAPLDERLSFENFVVGPSNELAYAAARRITERRNVSFNPLFLYGGVGLGKTHLLHAMALEINKNWPERKVLYLSAEKFMYQFIKALRFKDTMAFKQQFRSVDVLMIDDIQFIAGKDSTQEEFFHTFNTLIDHNHQVIISADRSPVDLDGIEERIRSRLGWGLVADIHPSDYELRLGVLQSKAESHLAENPEIDIPDNLLEFLAQRIDSNIRVLEGALNRVIAYSSFANRPLSIDMAKEVLKDLIRASQRKTTIDDIQRKVADYYNLRLSDLLSARRSRTIARPRQIAMYLSKILTTRSLPEIGRKFGGRDHTTVIHAVKKIEDLRVGDVAIDEEVEVLRRSLEN